MGAWPAEPLPEPTLAAVREQVATLADDILAAVGAEVPAYREVIAAPEGMALRLGIEEAIRAFLEAVQQGRPPRAETDELWRRLGEAEFQSGRRLEDLRTAFRTGIRAAWRGAADVAIRTGVPAPVAISLAEAIFVFGDDLATDIVEGYLRIASDEAGETRRRRRRLGAALLDSAGQDPEAVARAAELAAWPLPRALCAVALVGDEPDAIARRLDPDVLAGVDADGAWLVVPDPDAPSRRARLERALAGTPSALGPAVAPRHAERSLRWARRVLQLLPGAEWPVRADDHLAELIVLGDRDLAAALAHRRLAPLDGLPVGERRRLLDTLGAWLAHQRHTPRVAAELHVHPQTVRYRLARLHELLGDALDDSQARFELELALRIERAAPG